MMRGGGSDNESKVVGVNANGTLSALMGRPARLKNPALATFRNWRRVRGIVAKSTTPRSGRKKLFK